MSEHPIIMNWEQLINVNERSIGELVMKNQISALQSSWNPRRWSIFYQFSVILSGIGLGGAAILIWYLPETTNQVTTIVQYFAAVGTISLAAATFYNIQLTNQDLRLRRQQREKPLAIDELSKIIEPAIQAISRNLEILQNGENGFDWVYVQEPVVYNVAGSPRSALPIHDIVSLQRLNENNRRLYQQLLEHDEMIVNIAGISQRLVDEVSDSVRSQLEKAGYSDDDYSQSVKVFVSAMLKRLDHFGESHEMYDFWEENRGELLEILDQEVGSLVEDLEERVPKYQEHCEELLEALRSYKADVQQEYGISSDEFLDTDPFERELEPYR